LRYEKTVFRLRYKLYKEKDRNGRWAIIVRDKRKKKEYILCEKFLARESAEVRIKQIYSNGEW